MAYSPHETQMEGNLSECLVTILHPASAASEAYRTVRTSLLYASVDTPPKVIVVTSPASGEGKSTLCANLSVALTQAGKNTLLVDCDFRRPVIHSVFGLRNIQGLVDMLVERRSLQEVCQEPLSSLGLKVLSVGTLPPDPTELLGSQRFSDFLTLVREKFDFVLIDSPPIGLVSDPIILAAQGDGVLLTLDAQKTSKKETWRAINSLRAAGANVLGTVVNNAKLPKGKYYPYYY